MKSIKANWAYILAGVIFLLFSLLYFHSCTVKKADTKIEVSSDKSVKQLTIDSMKLDNLVKLSDQKDSLIQQGDRRVRILEIKTNGFKAQNKSLRIQVDTLFKSYNKRHTLGSCDSLVAGQVIVITSNDSTIKSQGSTIDELQRLEVGLKANCNIKDSIIYIQKDQIKTINTDFTTYKTQTLKKEKSNKFLNGVKNIGLGVLAGLLIIKSL